jgi:hypothetical protein
VAIDINDYISTGNNRNRRRTHSNRASDFSYDLAAISST